MQHVYTIISFPTLFLMDIQCPLSLHLILLWTRLKCLTHSLIFPINVSLSWTIFSCTLWIFYLGYFQCWISIGFLTYPLGMGIWFFLKFVYLGSTSIEAKIWKLVPSGINMYKVYNFHTMVWLSWYWNVWYQKVSLDKVG